MTQTEATGQPVKRTGRKRDTIHFGYVRLLDAAPILVAESLGIFRDAGLVVKLHREAGWATIRDKLAFRELDVVQALSPMPFIMQLGIGVTPTDAIAGMILNCNGNAITLSSSLWKEGVRDGATFRRYLRQAHRPPKPVLGVVSLYSSHHFMLCRWLEKHGLNSDKDVLIAVLPPEQMVRNLASNNIDGFCAGDPWNSMAVAKDHGWVAATGAELLPGYPEKVMMTTTHFHAYRPQEYIELIKALERACAYCEAEQNREEIAGILSREGYLDCPAEILHQGLKESFSMGNGTFQPGSFIGFHAEGLHRPGTSKGETVFKDLARHIDHPGIKASGQEIIRRTYREDLYDEAMGVAPLLETINARTYSPLERVHFSGSGCTETISTTR